MSWHTVDPTDYHSDSYLSIDTECTVPSDRPGCWYAASEGIYIDLTLTPEVFSATKWALSTGNGYAPVQIVVRRYAILGGFTNMTVPASAFSEFVIDGIHLYNRLEIQVYTESESPFSAEHLIHLSYFTEQSDFWTNKVRTTEVI